MSLAAYESAELDRANESALRPVVFIHGLWLLPCSWERWRSVFEQRGYITLASGWPDDPRTMDEARRRPDVFARKSLQAITAHYREVVNELRRRPILIGHSFGGLIAQMIAGEGRADATAAIDAAPFRGVLPLPISAIKSIVPVLRNPLNYFRATSLTFQEFRYGWANALPEAEARSLFDKWHVPGSAVPLFQAATANLNPWTACRVNTRHPRRGPLLLISGSADHTVPPAVVVAAYRK